MSLNIKKCVLCGKAVVCNEHEDAMCHDCAPNLMKTYERAREFLRENSEKGYSMSQMAEMLRVDVQEIQALVEAGRIEYAGAKKEESNIRRAFEKDYEEERQRIAEKAKKGSGWYSRARKR